MESKKGVLISEKLYHEIKKKLDDYGFKSVDEYVEFVVGESLTAEKVKYTKEDEEEIKRRLRELGYID